MSEFTLRRLGMVMEPEPGNPLEVEGVLNPAAVRRPNGELYLFPRLVAKGNYSPIGIARLKFNEAGDPVGAKRLGIALETDGEVISALGHYRDRDTYSVEPSSRSLNALCPFIFFQRDGAGTAQERHFLATETVQELGGGLQLSSCKNALYPRSDCRITAAFRGLRYHHLTCILLRIRLVENSSSSINGRLFPFNDDPK